MAAIKFIKRTVALDGNSVSEQLPASFFNSENTAHTFIIAGVRDNAAVPFTGASVSATFLNANDAVVLLTGSVVSGAAVVTLSNDCYALDGRFILTISVNGAVVYECQSRIKRRSSSVIYDPTGEISAATLTAEIAAMRTATAAANTATTAANTAANNANVAAANVEHKYNTLKTVIGLKRQTPFSTVNNYSLYRNGLSHYDQSYHLVKYQVTPGGKVLIICEEPTSTYAAYQFQSGPNVSEITNPNPYLIGEPVSVATSAEVTVPAGAEWLIFSERNGYSGNGVYTADVVEREEGLEYIAGKFLVRAVAPFQIVNGWKLVNDGRCEANSGYKLVKYRTSPGGEYYLRGYSTGDILYQFQEAYGVGTSFSSAIDPPGAVKTSVEGIVASPSNGYYLIMSIPIGDTVSGMYELVDKDDLLPDYWETYLEGTALPKIYANNVSVGSHGVSFVFFTDQHTQQKSANLINRVCNAVAGGFLMNGGDIINGSTDKAAEIATIRKMMKAIPNHTQFVMRGNHDSNTNFSESTAANEISESEFYGLCLKPVEDKIVSGGQLYYYMDNANQKVRYIVLDTKGYVTDIDDTQIAWMTARITELTNDWTVVIFAHKVYTSVDNIDPSGTKIINALTSISTGAKIACIVSGHAHHDQYYTIGGKFPLIITTALNAWQESTTQGTPLERTWGTDTEFAFDVYHIDTQAKQIKVTRIGAGSDRTFSYVG